MPIAIEGLTEVLMPTERKHEYWRMMGVLKFSKPALGQMYHYGGARVSDGGHSAITHESRRCLRRR